MADPIDVAVGLRIRTRRKQVGLSQAALAEHLGVSFQQVQKYERGANRVSASMLVRTAEKLGCTAGALLGEGEGDDGLARHPQLTALADRNVMALIDAFTAVEDAGRRHAILVLARNLAAPSPRPEAGA